MENYIWYNVGVPIKYEKKDVQLAMKVSESLRQKIEEIAEKEDRPVGYIARELMIRGVFLYESDGKLRGIPPEALPLKATATRKIGVLKEPAR